MHGFAQREFIVTFFKPQTSIRMERIVAIIDENMMVTSSLVDNDFSGADLVFCLSSPEEVTVRGLAQFSS